MALSPSNFVSMYNARAHTPLYIPGDPLPCGEISRAGSTCRNMLRGMRMRVGVALQ